MCLYYWYNLRSWHGQNFIYHIFLRVQSFYTYFCRLYNTLSSCIIIVILFAQYTIFCYCNFVNFPMVGRIEGFSCLIFWCSTVLGQCCSLVVKQRYCHWWRRVQGKNSNICETQFCNKTLKFSDKSFQVLTINIFCVCCFCIFNLIISSSLDSFKVYHHKELFMTQNEVNKNPAHIQKNSTSLYELNKKWGSGHIFFKFIFLSRQWTIT